jgi:hypothetical protein
MRSSVQREDVFDGVEKDMSSGGLVGLLLRLWKDCTTKTVKKRRMELLEVLPVGGKRLMMLVRCDGEEFLAAGGLDSVQTIVKIGKSAGTGEAYE